MVVNGHSGLLVNQYGSPAAFARAIALIKRNPGLAKRLAINARTRVVSRFSWYSTVRKLKAHYYSVRAK